MKKFGDIISGTILLGVAANLYLASFGIKTLVISRIGSGFVPRVVAFLLALVSITIIVGGFKKLKGQNNVSENSNKSPINSGVFPFLKTFCLIAGYIALLEKVGFLIMTPVYLFTQFYLLTRREERKMVMFAIVSLVTSVSVYYLFVLVFHLMLPAGILG
ncbi:MAG TPA: tripartite tricarboxylate transporter TctB family protein [Bacillota bacterium]|nr:tripartite tricarboxylate transporter TctB family protein [Bacillota bacterium]